MIVLHFFLISLGLVSREEEKEETEQAGSEENDQQAHRKRRETTGAEKTNCLMHHNTVFCYLARWHVTASAWPISHPAPPSFCFTRKYMAAEALRDRKKWWWSISKFNLIIFSSVFRTWAGEKGCCQDSLNLCHCFDIRLLIVQFFTLLSWLGIILCQQRKRQHISLNWSIKHRK